MGEIKQKWPIEHAIKVAAWLVDRLKPVAARITVAGSIRRRRERVGDVEILFIPKFEERRDGLFDVVSVSMTDILLDKLLADGLISKRQNIRCGTSWGEKNKLAVDVASGIPVDFFTATEGNWFNYLVCRTGPAESNTRICMAAQDRGWKWNPYGAGFSRGSEARAMTSEKEVFEFVGLPFLPPEKRL